MQRKARQLPRTVRQQGLADQRPLAVHRNDKDAKTLMGISPVAVQMLIKFLNWKEIIAANFGIRSQHHCDNRICLLALRPPEPTGTDYRARVANHCGYFSAFDF